MFLMVNLATPDTASNVVDMNEKMRQQATLCLTPSLTEYVSSQINEDAFFELPRHTRQPKETPNSLPGFRQQTNLWIWHTNTTARMPDNILIVPPCSNSFLSNTTSLITTRV